MGAVQGKAVVITGAGRGLGAAYARHAAEQGAAVVVNDVDEAQAAEVAAAITAAGGSAVAHAADISDWDAAGALVERCVAEFGAVDGLVNNAGLFALCAPEDCDEASLRSMLEVNVLGTAFCGVHALRHMRARDRGSIVNVTSGEHAGRAAMGAYGASKGAIASLTYSWAADVAGTGVRVNAISPNAHTRMADTYEAFLGVAAQGQNVGKAPEDNAPAVVFLLSDLSGGVNGQVVRVNGRELSLLTHPMVLEPTLTVERWTVEEVHAAFTRDLGARLQPLGLASTGEGARS